MFLILENLVHVHVRKSDEKMSRSLCISLGLHTIPVTVEAKTANFVLSELGNIMQSNIDHSAIINKGKSIALAI